MKRTDNFSKFATKKKNSAIKEEFRQEKKKFKKDYINELNVEKICPTVHSSELNEIFFETIDHMDCYFDPMSIHR